MVKMYNKKDNERRRRKKERLGNCAWDITVERYFPWPTYSKKILNNYYLLISIILVILFFIVSFY